MQSNSMLQVRGIDETMQCARRRHILEYCQIQSENQTAVLIVTNSSQSIMSKAGETASEMNPPHHLLHGDRLW